MSSLELIYTEDMVDRLVLRITPSTTHLINLIHNNTNPLLQKFQNVAAENNEFPATQTGNKTADQKENESSNRHESFVIFMGHYIEDESHDLLPAFGNVNQNGLYPKVLQAEIMTKCNLVI